MSVMQVSIQRPDGTWKRFKPISKRSDKRKHENGTCWWLCSYCDLEMQKAYMLEEPTPTNKEDL